MTTRRTPQQLEEDALAIWNAGVSALDSELLVRQTLVPTAEGIEIGEDFFPHRTNGRLLVVGAGKAGAGMAAGIESALGPQQSKRWKLSGWVNVPDDCVSELSFIHLHGARPAGLNEPTEAGAAGTAEMIRQLQDLTDDDLCIVLVSGGGSALMPAPISGVSLSEKQAVTRFLSQRGANIVELNTVRKSLSQVKGGGLLRHCRAPIVSLVISDVLGDPLEVIASGPTVSQDRPVEEAKQILSRFDPNQEQLPPSIYQALNSDSLGLRASRDRNLCPQVCHYVIGNNALAVDAAGMEAERRGYSHAMHCSTTLEGDVTNVAQHHAQMALRMQRQSGPDCLITGGEPTVKIDTSSPGHGGRNQQLALLALENLLEANGETDNASAGVCLLSGGTDGEDGPTDAAGAWIGPRTLSRLAQETPDWRKLIRTSIENFDAYTFFEKTDSLLKTGPTHTNVCDLRVIVVDRVQPQKSAKQS